LPKGAIFNQYEIPRLHKSDRSGMMSSREDSNQNVVGYWSGLEMPPYITSQHDSFVNCCAFRLVKAVHK
jgi:hypothetical protein